MKKIAADVAKVLEFNMTQPCFTDTWLFRQCHYVQLWSLVTNNSTQQIDVRQSLLAAAQGRPIIINAVTDPTDPNFIVDLLDRHNITDIGTVLINDREFAQQRRPGNFRWFPVWILKAITASLQSDYAYPAGLWHSRIHRVSCLNRIPKHHRFYTFYLLNQLPWFKEIYLSFGGFDPLNDSDTDPEDYFSFFNQKEIQWFRQHQHQWPIKHDETYQWVDVLGQHDPFTPAYRDCYANIATESEITEFCPTEKTTKCLRTGLLLFAVAAQGHMRNMSNMGFDLDYQGIDLSYDMVPDWRQRIEACVNEVNRVYPDIPDIWHTNQAKLQYNSELFFSTEFANSLLIDVQDIIASPYSET